MQTDKEKEVLSNIQQEIENEDGGDDVAAMWGTAACVVMVTKT
jgi:hypothetical protein